ncbi:MAG: dTMP kinase [Xenococcaceae cyanobacterium]
MKNLFIVFEGIDGSGTSTQASLLKDYFIGKGYKAVLSPEPSMGPIGKLIREVMQKKIIFANGNKFDEQMAYLFAADRHYHLYNDVDGVFKLINDKVHVISTRYYFSSLAYNCQTKEEFEFVRSLNQKFPKPDLAIYIDIPIKIALTRLSDRSFRDVYENEDKLVRVRKKFQDVFQEYDGVLLKVDGTESKDSIHQKIVSFIEDNFPE